MLPSGSLPISNRRLVAAEDEKRERETLDLLFHLFTHSLVDSCMCSDWGLNPQPFCIGRTLEPTELAGQGSNVEKNVKVTAVNPVETLCLLGFWS